MPDETSISTTIGDQDEQRLEQALRESEMLRALYEQAQAERRRAEQLIERVQSIYEVANAVNAGADLPSVLTLALQHLVNSLMTNGGAIVLLQDTTFSLIGLAQLSVSAAHTTTMPALTHMPRCFEASQCGIPLFFRHSQLEGHEAAWFRQLGFEDVMIVPLTLGTQQQIVSLPPGVQLEASAPEASPGERTAGFALLNYPSAAQPPTRGQLAFARDVAAQCAHAIEKERILNELRQTAALATERALSLKSVNDNMQETNRLKDEFISIAAHEFGSPLTVILTNSQFIQRTIRKTGNLEIGDRLQEQARMIEEQAHQLHNIIHTFMDVTKLNLGKVELTMSDVDIAALAQEAVHAHQVTTSEHTLSCSSAHAVYPYIVYGDSARLRQVFSNLLQNAIKYSPLGGDIQMSLCQFTCESGQMMIEVRVCDSGIGISAELLPHVFERFYRGPSIDGGKIHGLGLGLYIVARIVRIHGGDIRAESSGRFGEGSEFIVTLPLLKKTLQS